MTQDRPDFIDSENFVMEDGWRLLPQATDKEKREFEEFMNEDIDNLKAENPGMKKPYYTWEGKVIDKE